MRSSPDPVSGPGPRPGPGSPMEPHVTSEPSQETMDEQSFHDCSALTIEGEHQEMSEYRGRLVLVVNIATECAFTPQLASLQELSDAYDEHGFTVLDFPAVPFHQGPGTVEETQEICASSYDV